MLVKCQVKKIHCITSCLVHALKVFHVITLRFWVHEFRSQEVALIIWTWLDNSGLFILNKRLLYTVFSCWLCSRLNKALPFHWKCRAVLLNWHHITQFIPRNIQDKKGLMYVLFNQVGYLKSELMSRCDRQCNAVKWEFSWAMAWQASQPKQSTGPQNRKY